MEPTEVSEGMQRLIGARRDMDDLLAGLRSSVATDPSRAAPEGSQRGEDHSPRHPRGGDWEILALERRLAALEERAERAVVHLEAQSKLVEERAETRVDVVVKDAAARIEAMVSAAELRLAAVDFAQEREERVRERVEAARREAEERVREAERRLVEVLARIDRPRG